MASGIFPRIGQAATNTYNSINATMKQHQQQMSMAGRSIDDMRNRLDKLYKRRDSLINVREIERANSEIGRLENRVSRLTNTGKGGGMMGSIIGGSLVAGAISATIGAIKNTAVDSVNAAMTFGMQERSFQVLAKDKVRGQQLANELRQMKQNTLVGAGVYGNAQTMLGFGVSDKDVIRKLREVGDVGMGDAEKMQSLTLARSQVTAAGKLMGQDLLQFVNAGFNPLNVMADQWQQFGFKAKVTIGQLKDMVSEGKISSAMVDKAFEVATSKGGQFYKMMEQVGDTAGGKMLKLQGAWAAAKIDMGNALMPMATEFMNAGSKLLHFLNISKSVPDVLRNERAELTSLMHSVMGLNEGNAMRVDMLNTLKTKYPEFLSSIDAEKATNKELLDILNQVNKSYKDRIGLAVAQDKENYWQDKIKENERLMQAYMADASMLRDYGYSGGNLTLLDKVGGLQMVMLPPKAKAAVYDSIATHMGAQNERDMKERQRAQQQVEFLKRQQQVQAAYELVGNPAKEKELWGKAAAQNHAALQKELDKLHSIHPANAPGNTGYLAYLGYDMSAISKLMNPAKAPESSSAAMDSLTSKATTIGNGGQKVVNIKFNNVVGTMTVERAEGQAMVQAIEPDLEQAINRIFARVY